MAQKQGWVDVLDDGEYDHAVHVPHVGGCDGIVHGALHAQDVQDGRVYDHDVSGPDGHRAAVCRGDRGGHVRGGNGCGGMLMPMEVVLFHHRIHRTHHIQNGHAPTLIGHVDVGGTLLLLPFW